MSSVYTTPAKVRQALVPSATGTLPSSPTNTAADFTDTQLQDAIDEASAQIDSYIGRFYTTPVAQVEGVTPDPISFWARNIAAYNATLSYRGSQDFTDDDPIARRWRATMEALQMVALGKAELNLPTSRDNTAATVGNAVNPYLGELWTPDDFSLSPHFQNGPSWDGHW
jgi:phage gp36-like protein